MSNFDFDINKKKNNDFASTFYPPWLRGDLDFFQGIYDQYKVYGPKASNLNALDINSKKHRDIVDNLSIIDNYEIGGDEAMAGAQYLTRKQPGQSQQEKLQNKIYHPGISNVWNQKKALEMMKIIYTLL